MIGRSLAVILFILCAASSVALAHESRPASLDVREETAGVFRVIWKTPMTGDLRLPIEPFFDGAVRSAATFTRGTDAAIETWTFTAPSLRGRTLAIRGLEATLTDVFVRIAFLDGVVETHLLRPNKPSVAITGRRSTMETFGDELLLGVQHIAFGFDHLLFVLGLLLIVADRWMLTKTITSFTIAHSLTLGLATFGRAHAPAAPLNAAIALSILFLGPEIVRRRNGESSITIRRPWLVAFAFGLLHGFGFAGALIDSGVPRADLPLVLAAFNIGVEIGQLGFVVILLALVRAFRNLEIRWPAFIARLPEYAVGVLGAYWTIERTVLMIRERL